MGKNAKLVAYGIVMVAILVAMDILFFRNHFQQRLIANVGVVLIFVVFYLVFLRRW